MGERYRLPEALGGGEVEVLHGFARLEDDGRVDVKMEGLSEVATVPRTWLTKVEPPLPPEPPVGAVVVDSEGDAWQRRKNEWGVRHWVTPTSGDQDWATLVEHYGPLTRLVPDPAAGVELPWGTQPRVWVDESMVGVRYKTDFWLGPDAARAMAAALWAAADAAEAGAP